MQKLPYEVDIEYDDNNVGAVDEYFASHPPIKFLHLIGRHTDKIPVNLDKLDSLKSLTFILDKVPAQFPASLGRMSRVDTLELRIAGATEIPQPILNLTSLTYLDVSSSDIKRLPAKLNALQSLEYLNISNTKITELPALLNEMPKLTKLYISSCPINQNYFTGTDRLEYLVIDENPAWADIVGRLTTKSKLKLISLGNYRLTSIPPKLKNAAQLETLLLSTNNLKDSFDFSTWKNLKILDLSGNSLTNAEVSKLKFSEAGNKVINLDLSFNHITKLPDNICQLTNLTGLNLGNNDLESLPLQIGALCKLKSLNLEKNALTRFPSSIKQLQLLDTLNLSTSVNFNDQNSIFSLLHLKELDLSNSNLFILEPTIGQLKDLTKLDLGDNKLENLPKEAEHLQKLKELNLSDNNFFKIPTVIESISSLETLDIQGNHLTDANLHWEKLHFLDYLILEDTHLKKLPTNISTLNGSLITLNLNKNPLLDAKSDLRIISNLQKLRGLYMQECQVKELPSDLARLKKLESFDLTDNKIADGQMEVIKKLPALKQLNAPVNQIISWRTILSYLLRVIVFVLGAFLLISSIFLYRSEQGSIENKVTIFWIFITEESADFKGLKFFINNFINVVRRLFNQLLPLRLNNLKSWGVIICFNCAFLTFYDATGFIVRMIILFSILNIFMY